MVCVVAIIISQLGLADNCLYTCDGCISFYVIHRLERLTKNVVFLIVLLIFITELWCVFTDLSIP